MTYTLIKLAFKVSDMANKASSDYLALEVDYLNGVKERPVIDYGI